MYKLKGGGWVFLVTKYHRESTTAELTRMSTEDAKIIVASSLKPASNHRKTCSQN